MMMDGGEGDNAAAQGGWTSSPHAQRRALHLLSVPLHDRSPVTRNLSRLSEREDDLRSLDADGSAAGGDSTPLLLGGRDRDASENGQSSFAQATLNGVNVIAGVGILSLPYAFRLTGWLLGLGFLTYLCLVTNHTGKLIGYCMGSSHGCIRTYGDLGGAAFGRRGQAFITVVFCLELVAALAMYITIMGDNLHKVLEHGENVPSHAALYMLCTAVVLPTCLTSRLDVLSNLSVVGIISSFALLLALLWTGATCAAGKADGGSFKDLHMDDFRAVGEARNLPYAIGLQMVGFAGHAVFPSIYDSLASKQRFDRLMDIVYVLCSTLYLSMGVVGYLLFTNNTQQELTLNLYDVAGDTVVVRVTIWLIIINPFTKFALTLNPLAEIAQELLGFPSADDEAAAVAQGAGWSIWARRSLLRVALVALSLLLATSLPSFASICAFIGAFCSFVVSAIFPVMCYLELFKGKLSRLSRTANTAIAVLNTLLCVLGTAAVFFPPTLEGPPDDLATLS